MSNPIPVRFPCEEHGEWFRHMVKPVGVKPVWCDGGTTRLLTGPYWDVSPGDEDDPRIWVEVEHE